MARIQLSLSSGTGSYIPKQSSLRETLTTNDIMGEIPCGLTSSDRRNAASPSPPPPTAWPSDEASEQQQQPSKLGLRDKLFSFFRPSSISSSSGGDESTPQKLKLRHELFSYFINRTRTKKLISFLIIVSLILVIVEYILYNNSHISTFTKNFLDWMKEYGDLAVIAYIVMMSLLTLFFVPPSLFVFASGFIFQDVYGSWGILVAWVSSFIGAMVGGSLGFWRARYLSRDLVEILMRRYPILRAVDAAIVKNSLRVMMLMRLNPLIPFGVMNYIFGISGVDLFVFILAIPAVLPWYLFLICLGAVSSSMYSDGIQDNVFGVVLISTGVASGIIGLVITWRFAKKELQKDAEVNMWRMAVVNPKKLPEVGSRSHTPTSSMLAAPSSGDNTVNGFDEENPPSSNVTPLRVEAFDDIQVTNDEYNDNIMIDTNNNMGKITSRDSSIGEKVKEVVRKLKLKSKSEPTIPTTTTPPARRCTSTTTNIIIEDSDLRFADYFRTQVLGEDDYGDNDSAYRNNLDWTEIILDDFS